MSNIKHKKENKKVGAYLGLSLNSDEIERGFNLGHSPDRWAFAIGLGVLFLASIFGSMIFDPTISLGVIFFWGALWLGWPKKAKTATRVYSYVLLQVLFCFIFIVSLEWGGKRLYESLGEIGFRMIFQFLVLPFWLWLGHLTYGFLEKKYFERPS